MLATSNSLFDPAWYPNSGVSAHSTPDYNNFNNSVASYLGTEQVKVGIGTGTPLHILVMFSYSPLILENYV